jgi:hypothetical protein
MCGLRNIYKNVIVCLLLLTGGSLFAQEGTLLRAQQLVRAKNYDLAKLTIDSAITHPQTANDFITWTTRAYAYYGLYAKTDKFKLNSKLRDTTLASIQRSYNLKPDSDYASNNQRVLISISSHYFNLAKSLLQDSANDERSLMAYKKYKEITMKYEPAHDFKAKDVEYYLAVGSQYSDMFTKDNNNTKAQEVAKVALLKVLDMQPDNGNANMNLGLMYYNQAVNLSKSLDYGADFTQIDFVQENMVKLAKQSEQFIYKVYNNDNKNVKAVQALYYIYRMLNELPKSDEFKKKAIELGVKFNETETNENKEGNKDK